MSTGCARLSFNKPNPRSNPRPIVPPPPSSPFLLSKFGGQGASANFSSLKSFFSRNWLGNLETSPDGRISTATRPNFPLLSRGNRSRHFLPLFFSRTVIFFSFLFLFWSLLELTGNQNTVCRISLYVVIEVLSSRVCLKSRSLRMDV